MSQWGLFLGDDGTAHMAPKLPDGRLQYRHSKHEFCPCGPRSEELYGRTIWVHQDDERESYDA